MSSDEENVKYLYLVLTTAGPPTINWVAVGKDLDLKPSATSKRWSRLKISIAEGKNPGPTAYQFLWLCVKHCTDKKAPNWNLIAEKCGTTSAAASKRYSRLKLAIEKGEIMPIVTTPPKGKGATVTGADGEEESAATSTPTKRKRGAGTTSPRGKTDAGEEVAKGDEEDPIPVTKEGGDEGQDKEAKKPAKRAKTAKSKASPKPKRNAKKSKSKKASLGEDITNGGDTDPQPAWSAINKPSQVDPEFHAAAADDKSVRVRGETEHDTEATTIHPDSGVSEGMTQEVQGGDVGVNKDGDDGNWGGEFAVEAWLETTT
ncbi:uncharacterized protein BDR25DRAFT_386651 [Lindgomyces ingoldianus]|uniref:Uncharacterized protein n=1 Tax=Lindgomyces ingoldianus TaxID=673940 RepID=A0ACB6R3E0_9PLEO|nr:uncharacterized protein BDR25DRAFT_386651 [Lindgomyces ingoldianus]KAF2473773.1 hypothetical protein BDR25DRAFT_386651 [Lindgomyces ingoldianus]